VLAVYREDTALPKQTFFNLPEEKRDTLIHAAKNEFSRVSLYEASIANIVKEADIPRGSFYQYFEDKDDLYFYLLDKQGEELWKTLITNLKEHQGDLFESLLDLFHTILRMIDDEEARNFYRNVFLNMNYRTEKTFNQNVDYDKFLEKYTQIKDLVLIDVLNIKDEEDLFHILQMTTTIMFQNIILKFAHNLSNEEAYNNFDTQLTILKRGFLKLQEEVE